MYSGAHSFAHVYVSLISAPYRSPPTDLINTCAGPGHDPETLLDWEVFSLPLIDPGYVLPWSLLHRGESTVALLANSPRKSFDSLHGGVWHSNGLVPVQSGINADSSSDDEGVLCIPWHLVITNLIIRRGESKGIV